MFLINIALFGVVGIIIWSIQMAWTPIFAAGGINGAGHYWGYRNFNTNDDSTNMSPIAFFIGGEELHNNHHAFPTAAKFSLKPWEFDIGWMYIKIFQLVGQIKVKRLAVKSEFIHKLGNQAYTRKILGLDCESIVKFIREIE